MTSAALGLLGEDRACAALTADGFTILGRRLRTACGEIDVVAATEAILVFVEVKRRATLAGAAAALRGRQQARVMDAAAILLAENPAWRRDAIRFDVLLVDGSLRVRRITDAFRLTG